MSESSSQSSRKAISAAGVFVGRQRELGEFRAALEESLAGRGRLAMLVGEPGIGKTRTAQELASYAETRGIQVLWGRCYEEEGAPPTGPGCNPSGPMFSSETPNGCSRRWAQAPPTSQKSFPKYGVN